VDVQKTERQRYLTRANSSVPDAVQPDTSF